jgi:hypothetical protein
VVLKDTPFPAMLKKTILLIFIELGTMHRLGLLLENLVQVIYAIVSSEERHTVASIQ